MSTEKTALHQRIESGKPILTAEIAPPSSSDPDLVRSRVKQYAGKVHALGISDNREGTRMSALAAAALTVAEGVEPILHMVTRDRNRIALLSDCLGAGALGIHNILCTTGTHQTLGRFHNAKSVFDIDSIQLIQSGTRLAAGEPVVEEIRLNGTTFCFGGVAAPFADPLELQIMRLEKKCEAGARFLITQPVYNLDRFGEWWNELTRSGIHERAAILAGIRILTNGEEAKTYARERPQPLVPQALLDRLGSKSNAEEQRAEGIAIAKETIERLSSFDGLRGFEICSADDDGAVLELIDKSGLRTD